MVMILSNAHCTLYGNQISEYFNCYPPSLEEYFGVVVVVDSNLNAGTIRQLQRGRSLHTVQHFSMPQHDTRILL